MSGPGALHCKPPAANVAAPQVANAAPANPPPAPSPAPPVQQQPITPAAQPDRPNPSAPTGRPLPPPPPPRSTLPPVRSAPEISPRVSGVGSAAAPRWRGELNDIQRNAEAKQAARRAVLLAAETGQAVPEEALAAAAEDEESTQDRVKQSMPSWLVSTVMHLVALLILALIAGPGRSGVGRIMLDLGFSEQPSDQAELTEFAIESPLEVGEDIESSEVPVELDVADLFAAVEPAEELEITEVELGLGPEVSSVAAPMFDGRTGAMKKALLSIYGGNTDTVNAVELGLAWLARNQQRGGSWSMRGPYRDGSSSENKTAATAMAILAFCGDGNTHQSGKYQENVKSGLRFLVAQQGRDGFMAKQAQSHQQMYAQAQATIALCELYAMTNDSWLRPKAQLAIDFAESAQSSEGGWRYRPRYDSDTSVTGWYVMALKSAQASGLEVNDSKLRQVSDYLNTVSYYDGAGYAYQTNGRPSPAMTAEGLLCRQYLGWDREYPPMRDGLYTLVEDHMFDKRDPDVYYWYYATQALHHYGGSLWRQWNDEMRVQLPAIQVTSGREKGSWAPQNDYWGQNSGRLYTTCFSIYCLEVYYRHLPLYKDHAKGANP